MLKLYVGLLVSDQDRVSRHEETLWIDGRMCRQPPIQQLHGLESIRQTVWLWLSPIEVLKGLCRMPAIFLPASLALANSTCSSSLISESFKCKRAPASASPNVAAGEEVSLHSICVNNQITSSANSGEGRFSTTDQKPSQLLIFR